jgi:hypothetical protein
MPVHDLRSTQPLDRSISGHLSAIPVGALFKKLRFSLIANMSVEKCNR